MKRREFEKDLEAELVAWLDMLPIGLNLITRAAPMSELGYFQTSGAEISLADGRVFTVAIGRKS